VVRKSPGLAGELCGSFTQKETYIYAKRDLSDLPGCPSHFWGSFFPADCADKLKLERTRRPSCAHPRRASKTVNTQSCTESELRQRKTRSSELKQRKTPSSTLSQDSVKETCCYNGSHGLTLGALRIIAHPETLLRSLPPEFCNGPCGSVSEVLAGASASSGYCRRHRKLPC
jgi:hypothetical protein